jgi:cbb3-type cytochrome oxidase subunit 3
MTCNDGCVGSGWKTWGLIVIFVLIAIMAFMYMRNKEMVNDYALRAKNKAVGYS